jgi:hypothetical protein
MRTQPYSEFAFAIDLIMEQYKISNPILISEKIQEDLNIDISIHQISDYLSLNSENWERESIKQEYYNINY